MNNCADLDWRCDRATVIVSEFKRSLTCSDCRPSWKGLPIYRAIFLRPGIGCCRNSGTNRSREPRGAQWRSAFGSRMRELAASCRLLRIASRQVTLPPGMTFTVFTREEQTIDAISSISSCFHCVSCHVFSSFIMSSFLTF